MISSWKAFRRLSPTERRLTTWALIYLYKNLLALRLGVDFARRIRRLHPATTQSNDLDVQPAVIAIERLSRRLWPTPNCLVQSLALCDLLSRLQLSAEIRLLVKRDAKSQFEFHAAVFQNNRQILGENEDWHEAVTLKPTLERSP